MQLLCSNESKNVNVRCRLLENSLESSLSNFMGMDYAIDIDFFLIAGHPMFFYAFWKFPLHRFRLE